MKVEAAALSVRAQCCQSHYFSTTPHKFKEDEMGGAFSIQRGEKKCVPSLSGDI